MTDVESYAAAVERAAQNVRDPVEVFRDDDEQVLRALAAALRAGRLVLIDGQFPAKYVFGIELPSGSEP